MDKYGNYSGVSFILSIFGAHGAGNELCATPPPPPPPLSYHTRLLFAPNPPGVYLRAAPHLPLPRPPPPPQPVARRSAICVVPECSPLVVSGADPSGSSRGSGSLRGSGGLHRSPGNPDAADRKSYGLSGRFGGSAAAGGGGGGGGDGAWGPLPTGPGGRLVLGMGGRRENLGAWLLCDAVKSLLGALVAAPGHPDLGPFYLLRGLLKAARRHVSLGLLSGCWCWLVWEFAQG